MVNFYSIIAMQQSLEMKLASLNNKYLEHIVALVIGKFEKKS